MNIIHCASKDLETIFGLYAMATAYQKIKFPQNQWPVFERAMLESEIRERRLWKIETDGAIACVWTITFADPQIWEHGHDDSAIYIHRIATNPKYRGKNLVSDIVLWAKEYGISNHKRFIRMDTCGYNTKLIAHYQNCGFRFLGISKLSKTDNLPSHYHNAEVCFFEIELPYLG